ncbi:MAG: hypothetical protein LBR15_06320, partial [Methanobrevibacter sp.]|nr:hypothetical protein [Candidatus Methanovirga australis]
MSKKHGLTITPSDYECRHYSGNWECQKDDYCPSLGNSKSSGIFSYSCKDNFNDEDLIDCLCQDSTKSSKEECG